MNAARLDDHGYSAGNLPVRIINIAELLVPTAEAIEHPVALVVDATRHAELPVTILARLVRLRRVLRGAGGELLLAASAGVRQMLGDTGLLFAIPCYETVPSALKSLDAAA